MPFFHELGRENLRRAYVTAWRKRQRGLPLEPLEAQVANVIAEHPEYHALFEGRAVDEESVVAAEFPPEAGRENPFLHLGLHLAIREQVATDRPPGIAAIHAALARRLGTPHTAEHAMLEALGETLWSAQRAGTAPDEEAYLTRLRALVPGGETGKTPRRHERTD
jgi:hypothetical protein